MLDSIEKNYLRKLISKVKYSDLDPLEMKEFAFSPIGNSILEKLKDPKIEKHTGDFHRTNPNVKIFCYEFENHVGISIREKLNLFGKSDFEEISKWSLTETEKYVEDILGPIDYEKYEFDKLVTYLIEIAKKESAGNR